jgi:hypothetical protein
MKTFFQALATKLLNQALGTQDTFFFHFGITYRRNQNIPGVAMPFSFAELLNGKKVHYKDPDGLEGRLEIRDNHIVKSWTTGGPLYEVQLPVETWISRMINNGHDDEPIDDRWT